MTSSLSDSFAKRLGTLAKLLKTAERIGVDWSDWQLPIDNHGARQNLAQYLKLGCPTVDSSGAIATLQLPEGEDLFRLILGDDFVSPEEVAEVYGWEYSEQQRVNLTDALPEFEALLRLRLKGCIVVATPPVEYTLMELRELDHSIISRKSSRWFIEENQRFSREDTLKAASWLVFRKEPLPNPRRAWWDELTDEDVSVPNAPEAAYGGATYNKVRKGKLREAAYTATSSVAANGNRVLVGCAGKEGVVVSESYRDDQTVPARLVSPIDRK